VQSSIGLFTRQSSCSQSRPTTPRPAFIYFISFHMCGRLHVWNKIKWNKCYKNHFFTFYFMAHGQSVLLTDWLGQCKKYSSCVYEWMNEYCSMLPAFGAIVICIWRYFNCDYIVLLCVYKRELFGNTITTVSWYCRLLVFVYFIVLYARDINIDCRLYFIKLLYCFVCTVVPTITVVKKQAA